MLCEMTSALPKPVVDIRLVPICACYVNSINVSRDMALNN